ncbi:MAG TPA: SUMF1/EgtB/PvdO family nonheme iron enzyme, partial [Kofleriaceae bacterium]|nr:SUMF1/EgtB/PvdO family nonheme iron enzyme [Kofleriaceae bacterium]
TRRSVPRPQLVSEAGPGGDAVLDRLLSARLLVQRNVGDGEAPIIEIAHESLVQTWSQLARWLDESREERRMLEDLLDAAKLWERRGRRPEDSWSETDLATARHRAGQLGLAIPALVGEFFAAGDHRHRSARRRRRTAYGIALAIAIGVAIPTFVAIGKYTSREQLIQNNTGTVDLTIIPFDWVGRARIPVGIAAVPHLSIALHEARPDDLHAHGEELAAEHVRILEPTDYGVIRAQRIRAPGGTLFLRVDRRGREGEHCAPSWIRFQAFPGYRTSAVEHVVLWVPTCGASHTGMVTVPRGKFIYGGPGDPRSKHFGDPDYTEPEQLIDLPAFAMDLTEVSNAAFESFARLERITGYPAPVYANEAMHAHDGEPDYPVSEVDAWEAGAYCAYMGKQLPGDLQWVKAARGGLEIDGKPNPAPRRLYPWGKTLRLDCANFDGPADGYAWTAPVDSMPCGRSPYGIFHLGGNVQEWISREGQIDRANPMHILRGGACDAPVDMDLTTTVFRNARVPRTADYSLGFRCVIDDVDEIP